MRSFHEITYRLRQEAANVSLLLLPPSPVLRSPAGCLSGLPDPEPVARILAGSAYADEVVRLARLIEAGRYPLFGEIVSLGTLPVWRRDWKTGQESGLDYFRRIRYLDPETVGDHKRVWEPARHQHLVLLAQAALFGAGSSCIAAIERQICDFLDTNPFQRGMHWASALEVAFRALSWIWIDHLAGARFESATRERLRVGLYRHGCHLENNLSIYFSRNTHLLGEAVALHALGVLYPEWPRADRWRRTGGDILAAEIDYQVLPDGADFEQSSYYHIYALDMFLFHWLLSGRPEAMRPRLEAMAAFLGTLGGSGGNMPLTGDDDGGRLFHPYGSRSAFQMATLATSSIALKMRELTVDPARIPEQAAWWLGEEARVDAGSTAPPAAASRRFVDSGLVAMVSGETQILVDAGGFGSRRGGHSHSDSLQILIRRGDREILIDPGTFTYVSDRERRNWFRSTAAHNTVRIDGFDQGEMDYPFGWRSRPEVSVEEWVPGTTEDRLTAVCRYGGRTHRRTVVFHKPDRVEIVDEIEAGPGEHTAEQFWHFGTGAAGCLVVPDGAALERGRGGEHGWRSRCFGQIEEADYAVVRRRGAGTLRLEATIVIR